MTSSTVAADTKAIMPKPRTDKHIWGIYICLCIISMVELYSASSHEVTSGNIMGIFGPLIRHGFLLFIGLMIILGLQRTHYSIYFRCTYLITGISIAAMIYTLFFGDFINGARRSFSLGFMSVQPSEMIKIAAALIIARVLSTRQIRGRTDVETKGLIIVASVVILFGALLITQGLTNTILLMAISLSMMLVGGVSWKKFFIVVGVYCLLAGTAFLVKTLYEGHQEVKAKTEMVRPLTFVDSEGNTIVIPTEEAAGVGRDHTWKARFERFFKSEKWKDPITDKNQQEQYSYIAQANGGIIGVGIGNSRETSRLPLAFSDYIYAIVIEEGGLILGLFVLMLYLYLLVRAGIVAASCRTAFPALLVTGMAVFIAYQALFHMAIVTGVFPVSGQPLPLISKGGTSILITSVAFGVMLSVSRFAARKGIKEEIRNELSTLPENATAENL